jgi:hypothetical protein
VLVAVIVGTTASVEVGVSILKISLSLVQWFQAWGCGGLGKLLILCISDIFHHVHIHNEKRARLSTCAGVLGADAVEVEMEEWGEG